jgi:hypothetical protein
MPTLQPLDSWSEIHALPEVSTDASRSAVGVLGHIALGNRLPDDYVSSGLEQLEAHANSQTSDAGVQTDTRVHDIDTAHEAALIENEVLDAHVAALHENEIFDAHVAAIKEDRERAEIQVQPAERPLQQEEQVAAADKVKPEYVPTPSPKGPRQEAAEALKEAGFTNLGAELSGSSEVYKDLNGELTIVSGRSAKVITRTPSGSPQVTEYTYDRDNRTLAITTGAGTITGHVAEYMPTQVKQWQTRGNVITLPPILAKRFGMERAVVVKQK